MWVRILHLLPHNNYNKDNMNCINCSNILKKNATKFCSFKCNKEYEYKEYIKRWLNNEVTGTIGTKPKPSKHIYRFFRENNNICSECGITNKWNNKNLVLEIDHIDGDRNNNSFDNLRVLCPNCHSQTNTFRNKPRML